jgi:hypothetical protein
MDLITRVSVVQPLTFGREILHGSSPCTYVSTITVTDNVALQQ